MRSGLWSAISSVTSKRSRERVDHLADEHLRRRGSGGQADGRGLAEPLPVDVGGALDQSRGNAHPLGDLGEPKRIAAVGRADDQHPLAFGGDRLDRRLAVRGRVANVLAARRANRREARLERLDDRGGVVDRQRGLGQEGEIVRVRHSRCAATSSTVSTSVIAPSGTWPKVPITSGWPAWPMNRMWRPSSISRSRLAMNLGNERAGRIDIGEAAALRLGRHGFRNAMGGKDHGPVVGHLVELVDEHRAESRAAGRPRSGCGRSRAGHRPAPRTARARARRSGSRGRLRRKSRAAPRSAREEGGTVQHSVQAM